jgi:hypothetical protein
MTKGTRARARWYAELDKLFSSIEELGSDLAESQTIQDYFSRLFVSFFYSSLISNFFDNINKANARKYHLPVKEITFIPKRYAKIRRKAKSGLKLPLRQPDMFDEVSYKEFKTDLNKHHPNYFQLIIEIEKTIDLLRAGRYLKDKQDKLKSIGKPHTDLQAFLLTKIFEKQLQSKNRIPTEAECNRMVTRMFSKKVLDPLAQNVYRKLKKLANRIVKEQRSIRLGFEGRLYRRWKEPLDLLEYLIIYSLETGRAKKGKLVKTRDRSNKYKHTALIRIHARGIQISNEILELLKAGYADGANARWRSLHELATIAFFLLDNNNDIAERYLEHDIMKRFKEAKDYRIYYKKLGYPAFGRRAFNLLKKKHDALIQKYGKEFEYSNGFEWIPKTILGRRDFRELEKTVKLDKLRPYYSMSSNAVHGGSLALFFQLELVDRRRGKVLLAGPTNFGLADPLQGAAISLSQISVSLLRLDADVQDIMAMFIMGKYVDEIGPIAVKTQKQIESEERARPIRDLSSPVKNP